MMAACIDVMSPDVDHRRSDKSKCQFPDVVQDLSFEAVRCAETSGRTG
jgi:hypothetical protein